MSWFKKFVVAFTVVVLAASAPLASAEEPVPYWQKLPVISKDFDATKPVINGATWQDVRQTGAPTCSLLSSIVAALRSGEDLGARIRHLGNNEYAVRLFLEGKWVEEKVTFDGWTALDPAPNDPGEFWVSLFQRAYLQAWKVGVFVDGDKVDLARVVDGKKTAPEEQVWTSASLAMRTITGRVCQVLRPSDAQVKELVKAAVAEKRCVVAGTHPEGTELKARATLAHFHAYTVVEATDEYVLVRNPWGFDTDKNVEVITGQDGKPQLRYKQGATDGNDDNPNDGLIKLTWEEFMANYRFVVIAN